MRVHKWLRWEYGAESDENHPLFYLEGGAWVQPQFSMYFDRVWEWLLYCDRGEYLLAPQSDRTNSRYWSERFDKIAWTYAHMAAEFDEVGNGVAPEFRPFIIDVWDKEPVGKRVFVETLRWMRDEKLRSPIPPRLRLAGALQGLARFYHQMPTRVRDLAEPMAMVCGTLKDRDVDELDRYMRRYFPQKMMDEELAKGM